MRAHFLSFGAVLIVGIACGHHDAFAAPFLEVGAGYSTMSSTAAASGTTASSASGYGINTSLGFPLASAHAAVQPQLLMRGLLTSGSSSSGTSVGFLNLVPTIRFETSRLYLGGGLTPWFFNIPGGGFNIGSMSKVSGLGYHLEAGLLWRVVPYFHVALEANYSWAGSSPNPVLDFAFNMRFFFWEQTGSGGGGRRKLDGWRYPFGIEIN